MIRRLARMFVHYLRRRRVVVKQRLVWLRDGIDVAPGSYVDAGAVIGRRTRINGPSHLDPCTIGPYCAIGGRLVVRHANHYLEFLNIQEETQRRIIGGRSVLKPPSGPVSIGAGCWIGDSVVVLEGVQIGHGAVIGAGSVVTKSVPPYAIAVGNPARVIRSRFPDEVLEVIRDVAWWEWSDEMLRANKDLFETDLSKVDPDVLRDRLAQIEQN
jgi:acetyltransferase-like isoleucine patch superfamily enzyme